jgi:lysozyme
MNDTLTASPACLALIRRSEYNGPWPCKARWDVNGWACGYGCHGADVGAETEWSQGQAEQRLNAAVAEKEATMRGWIRVPVDQGQWDALVSWFYNLKLTEILSSTLLEDLNAGHYDDAGLQLLRWRYAKDANGNEVEEPGLLARRIEELGLWTGKTVEQVTAEAQARQGVAA